MKKTQKKGKKAKVVVKDLELSKVKGGAAEEDPKGGASGALLRTGFDPQPEPPGRGSLKSGIGSFNKR
jgi:hypothetical protein